MYLGSGTNSCDMSLEPTQELSITLVTLYSVCSVTLETKHKSLFLISPKDENTGPVIGSCLQGQLSVHFYKASYQSRTAGPVIGPFLQGQLSI